MNRAGRKPQGVELIQRLEGSAHAQQRMTLFLRTLAGECTVLEACRQLGIGESRFFAQRQAWLQQSLEFLEPRSPGRPGKTEPSLSLAEVRELQQRVQALEKQAAVVAVQSDLARTLPHVVARTGAFKKSPGQTATRPPRPK